MLNRVTLQNLQFNQLLSRIPARYSVALLEEAWLPGGQVIRCQPLQATLRVDDFRLPRTIKLWPHPESGVIHKIQLFRGREGLATLRVDVQLSGEGEVAKEYFTADYHLGDRVF